MSEINPRHDRALKVVERLIQLAPDPGLRRRAERLARHLELPMQEVIAKIPGDSVIKKARAIGVTRQALYSWLDGVARPSRKVARRIEKLTGLSADAVRGRAA